MLKRIDDIDYILQRRSFLAQLLRPVGIVPDGGVFQLCEDLFELFFFSSVVKDTPVAIQTWRKDPGCASYKG